MNKLFSLGMGQSCAIQLDFRTPQGSPVPRVSQPAARTSRREDSDLVPVFRSKDSVCGEIKITPIPGRRVDHQGIHVQLIGEIELASDRGRPHEFLSLVRDLSPPGELTTQLSLPFAFEAIELAHENYLGLKVRLRYLVRVSVLRGLGSTVTRDFPVAVRNPVAGPVAGPPIKMEVGIEDCLHIEFEYDRGAFALGDVVVGRIYFLLVRVKIKHMEVEIKRRETVGAGVQARSESETVAKYEIMDGAPARGEIIPIRLFLDPFDLTPSVENVHNRFSVKYFLNLVLVDDEDRRYFKQQEIQLYRGFQRDPKDSLPRGLLVAAAPPQQPSAAPSPVAEGAAWANRDGASSSSESAGVAAAEARPPQQPPLAPREPSSETPREPSSETPREPSSETQAEAGVPMFGAVDEAENLSPTLVPE